jgi:inhibitor of KinA sporulation pathway (predicted exonuclease)
MTTKQSQPIDHFVVLDFEATCCDVNPPRPQEIIEYPSILIDAETMQAVDEFSTFVRPVHHPQLSDFCTELTTIVQADVDSAPPFREVYESHMDWLRSHDLQVTESDPGRVFAFVTCGDWDLRTMFPTQCRAYDPPIVDIPLAFRRWINIKVPFAAAAGGRRGGMVDMMNRLGLQMTGTHHRGIDDCRNIAKILHKLIDDGWEPAFTAY